MTLAERCDIYGLPTCPWCGTESRIFLRAGADLVCEAHFPRHWFDPVLMRGETRREVSHGGLNPSKGAW